MRDNGNQLSSASWMKSEEWKGNIAEEATDHVYDPLQQHKPKDSTSTFTFIILYASVLGT